MALGHSHIEYLFHVPPEMIDDRERQPAFAVKKVLQLIALERCKRSIMERCDEMRSDALLVVLGGAGLPLAPVEVEVRTFDERPEQSYLCPLVRLTD